MKIPKVTSICGFKGVGKDTFADFLVERFGYKKIAFADPLKDKVAEWISSGKYPSDLPGEILENLAVCMIEFNAYYSQALKYVGAFLPSHLDYAKEYVRSKPYSDALRKLLQLTGTEYYRAKDDRYWIKSMHLDPDQRYVITDRRFFNEDDLSLAYGSGMMGIYRDGYGLEDKHASEVNVPSLFCHIWVENKFGEKDLIPEKCLEALKIMAGSPGVVTVEVE